MFTIPLSWEQWRCLTGQNTVTAFKEYGTTVLAEQRNLLKYAGGDEALALVAEQVNAFQRAAGKSAANVPAADQPPTQVMVTAANNLLQALQTQIGQRLSQSTAVTLEKRQAKWSPLNKLVMRQLTDADLILASSGGQVGWREEWGAPIEVDITNTVMIEEIRVLCAFILCADSVVGVAVPEDERTGTPVDDATPAFDGALVADTRPPGLRRGVEYSTFGVMRSWHIDLYDNLAPYRRPAVDCARRTAYRALNEAEFQRDEGIAFKASDAKPPKPLQGKRAIKQASHLVPQGFTEFNIIFGTQGRMVFDYDAPDFYISSHYQIYPAPMEVLTDGEKTDQEKGIKSGMGAKMCNPFFRLTNLHQIKLSWAGYIELGRLRYWENQRRTRHRYTIGE